MLLQTIYPSSKFHDDYKSDAPLIYAIVVGASFIAMACVFFVYDMFVQQRNNKLVTNAARSNAIVTSLFPSHIRDQFIGPNAHQNTTGDVLSSKNTKDVTDFIKSKPMADLYLETTVLFGKFLVYIPCRNEMTGLIHRCIIA